MTTIPSKDDDQPTTDLRPRRGVRQVLAAAAVVAVLATGVGAVADVTSTDRAQPVVESAASAPGTASNAAAMTGTTREATAAEQVGVVDIDTVLDYGSGQAAGTGLVLTSGGEILTNNHVVQDSTTITVTVVATGATYTASVVGTDATDDLAVLSLAGASGLTPAALADSAGVTTGTAVTAVGNAGGTGGTPTAATGSVTAVDQAITASDESGANAEQLSGLIEVSAAIQAGDSGGPLYAGGQVIGIDTAASTAAPTFRTAARSTVTARTTGYAIPIRTALTIAQRITSGEDGTTIAQGSPAFLGVQLTSEPTLPGGDLATSNLDAGGVAISGVLSDSPAATAGLADGDVITGIGGTTVSTATQLSAALATRNPGDHVRVTWTDADGATHSSTVVLTAGPAL